MRIGKLEIRWISDLPRKGPKIEDLSYAFAVDENYPFWKAVHQTVDEIEQETIEAARKHTGMANMCIADVGAGEGCAMIRLRLKRETQHGYRSTEKLESSTGIVKLWILACAICLVGCDHSRYDVGDIVRIKADGRIGAVIEKITFSKTVMVGFKEYGVPVLMKDDELEPVQ